MNEQAFVTAVDRRRFVATTGSIGLAGLAGCSEDDDDSDTETETDGEIDDETDETTLLIHLEDDGGEGVTEGITVELEPPDDAVEHDLTYVYESEETFDEPGDYEITVEGEEVETVEESVTVEEEETTETTITLEDA